jgi:hypothetical protein
VSEKSGIAARSRPYFFIQLSDCKRAVDRRPAVLEGEMLLLISISMELNTWAQPFDRRPSEWFNLEQDPMNAVGTVL